MADAAVLVPLQDHGATITLHRPGVMNANNADLVATPATRLMLAGGRGIASDVPAATSVVVVAAQAGSSRAWSTRRQGER